MSIMPEGEDIRKAVRWISDEVKYSKDKSRKKLVQEACAKFNLSPKEADYLEKFCETELNC